jgi:hypothetical protein
VKVEHVEPDAGFDAILNDSAFRTLLDEVLTDKAVLLLMAQVILKYTTVASLRGSTQSNLPSVHVFAAKFIPARPRSAQKVADSFVTLYGGHDPGHVRGAILEGLVERRLSTRYGGSGQDLVNNHKIRLSESGRILYTSSSSIDVTGWDGTVGECHDCKAASHTFRGRFILELETELVPRRFKVGLVTADSRQRVLFNFKKKGIPEPRFAQIVPMEHLWTLAPLQL